MSDSHSEQLDASKLGEGVGDDELATDGSPTETPMAVDDDTIVAGGVIARDDVATREARRAGGDRNEPDPPGLIETPANPDIVDDEPELLAESGDTEQAPEADAIRVTDD
jgi:hypothetical protein